MRQFPSPFDTPNIRREQRQTSNRIVWSIIVAVLFLTVNAVDGLALVPRRVQQFVASKPLRRAVQASKYKYATYKGVRLLKNKLPKKYHKDTLPLLKHFIVQYMNANKYSYRKTKAPESLPRESIKRILTVVGYGMKFGTGDNKFKFESFHQALRGDPAKEDGNTIDYYAVGNDIFRPCMDIDESIVLGQSNLYKIREQLNAGENVILLANHQSEADPQVVSCTLEKIGFADEAAQMIFVAGHKVTTDPLAVPFSMGRNLVCIHSKKHIDADPETKSAKQRQNLKAMGAMLDKLRAGGCLLWVAPSGGRDRRNLETGKVLPSPFDSKTVDMFRVMGRKSKIATHFYTFAMASYDFFPPPDTVVSAVGELRDITYMPVGVCVGDELVQSDVDDAAGAGVDDKAASRDEYCAMAYAQCVNDYHRTQYELGWIDELPEPMVVPSTSRMTAKSVLAEEKELEQSVAQ